MAKRHLKVTGDLGRVVFMVNLHVGILSIGADVVCRNTTFEIRHPSKKAFDIQMSFTILLDETTLLSIAYSDSRTPRTESP